MIRAKIPAAALCNHFRVRRIAAIPKTMHGDILSWVKERYTVVPVPKQEVAVRDTTPVVSTSLATIRNIVARHGNAKSEHDLLGSQA